MRKYVPWVLVVALMTASFAGWATANTEAAGPLASLRRRVTTLEIRADRQRRAIVTLREQNVALADRIEVLEAFRVNTNAWIDYLSKRVTKLDVNGDYNGPVKANQVSSAACQNVDAVWNATGGLDCPAVPA